MRIPGAKGKTSPPCNISFRAEFARYQVVTVSTLSMGPCYLASIRCFGQGIGCKAIQTGPVQKISLERTTPARRDSALCAAAACLRIPRNETTAVHALWPALRAPTRSALGSRRREQRSMAGLARNDKTLFLGGQTCISSQSALRERFDNFNLLETPSAENPENAAKQIPSAGQ